MRSALTQSLATGVGSSAPKQGSSRTLGNAFPCIQFGAGEGDVTCGTSGQRSDSPVSSTDPQEGGLLDCLDMSSLTLAGSAPTGAGGMSINGTPLVRQFCACISIARAPPHVIFGDAKLGKA